MFVYKSVLNSNLGSVP